MPAVFDGDPLPRLTTVPETATKAAYRTAMNVAAIGDVLTIGGVQVVGARGAAIADATDAASAITQLNLALAAMRTHGLIAST